MKIHLLTLALLTPVMLPAQEANPFVKPAAEEAAEPVPEDIIAGSLNFRVPRKLLPAKSGPVDAAAAGALLAQAWKWVEEGKAVLEDTSVATGGSGEQFITSSVAETFYPTEWVPAPEGSWHVPASIETRNVGFTQEWIPTSEGNRIEIRSSLNHTRFAGCRDYYPQIAATRQPGDMTSPVFDSENTMYESRAARGAWYLAARYDRSGDEETSRLCFARLDQRTRKPAVAMKDAKVLHCALEWIEVDHQAFAAWWAKTPMSDAAVGARAQADRMIAGGQGSLVTSQPFQAIPGRGTRAESLREVIYPTEFDTPYRAIPPQVPAAEGQTTPPAPPLPAGTIPSEGYGSSYPGTSYETRNTGYSTECEFNSVGQGLWTVRIVSEHVKDTGDIVMRRIKVNDQWIPDAKMPRFYCERVTTSFRIEPEVPLLIAVMAPPDAAGQPDATKRHLVFLTVNPEE